MKNWIIYPAIDSAASKNLSHLKPIYQQILFNRDLTDRGQLDKFFKPESGRLPEPFLLPDMQLAVDRLMKARDEDRRVVVYGDYDADGVTAAVLLVDGFHRLGIQAQHYIPNRFEHGYGVNAEAVEQFSRQGVDLVVSVDCGVRAVAEIDQAKSLGVDFIVTDHHHPGATLPSAVAVVNPRRLKQDEVFKSYSGVGIAYFLLSALGQAAGAPDLAQEYLDLVAIGTVADLAPLVKENRTLVAQGLKTLNQKPRPGLKALIDASGYKPGQLTSNSIGCGLGPRLNAAGRLDSAETAFQLLMSTNVDQALPLAARLESINRDRRRLTEQTIELARTKIGPLDDQTNFLFAMDESFNEGVVGLAASRLVDEFYRPAVVAAIDDQSCRGSARSIPEFHITEALEQCSDLLDKFGGHAAAAGFETRSENIPALVDRLESIGRDQLGEEELQPQLYIDAFVAFNEIDEDLMAFLDKLEPSGMENPRPVLATRKVEVVSKRKVGANGAHLKLALNDGHRYFDCIAFRMGDQFSQIGKTIDVAYRPEWNDYMGVRSLQLKIEDIIPVD
ncbi:MAG: single-stranded-DNA-specific exonuclease RecJ [Anaerolineales bacterium]